MGVGFCCIAAAEDAERIRAIAGEHGIAAWVVGHCVEDGEKEVRLVQHSLVGRGGVFTPV
jgi:phosphoribosylaminoimidazole (AIR) synthetase